MKKANPYLNFQGNTEEVFSFYRSVFGVEFVALFRFRDFSDGAMSIPEEDQDKIAHIAIPLGDEVLLMGTDLTGSQSLKAGNNVYIHLEAESAEEAERVFTALADGGKTEMSLASTEWAERFGSCSDKFGVQWMVNYEGDARSNQAQSR